LCPRSGAVRDEEEEEEEEEEAYITSFGGCTSKYIPR
jgi:hypothetical protein